VTSSQTAAGIVLVLATMGPVGFAADGTLLDETASGVVPVNQETLVLVRGIQGQVVLQPGAAAELEFRSTSPDKDDEEVPVGLWTDGEGFRLEPPRGHASVRARLTVSVPSGMKVRLELEHSAVTVMGLDNELAVFGRQLQFEAQGLRRSAQFEIEGGAVKVHVAGKGVRIRGRDLDVVVDGIAGRADVKLTGGTARLNGLQSGLQGDFTGTNVAIDTVSDAVSLHFVNGRAEVARLRDGGDIALTGCKLGLEQIGGALSITSDSAVKFNDCKASLRIENSAGSVTGVKNDGVLDVTTHNSQVALGQMRGQVRVAGDTLDVKLQQIDATVGVLTTSSSVALDVSTAPVTIENDGGDVVVKHTEAQVDVKSRGGNVHLLKIRGPVTVQADGELVEAEWEVLTSAADSKIVNEGGGVTVRFPPAGDIRVDATSRSGRVESSLAKLIVAEDRGSAKGFAGDGGQDLKTLVIKAAGDIDLQGSNGADPAGQAP
jgi:DUF4097 and DUF4098 domain-containing protein YvlB